MLRLVRVFMGVAVCVAAMTFTGATAFALETPTTGQPGSPTNTCGTANPVMPGDSASAQGSPFNSAGQDGVGYAGNPRTASPPNSNSAPAPSKDDPASVPLRH